MKKLSITVAIAIFGTLALGVYMLSPGQTDSETASGSASNQAVFITKTADFGGPFAVTNTDVENGAAPLGTASFNVDASSSYTFTAVVTFVSLPPPAVVLGPDCANYRCPFVLSLDGFTTSFAFGDVGLTCPSADPACPSTGPTSGTAGTDFNVSAALCFDTTWAGGPKCINDAPNGTYTMGLTATVTD